MRLLFTHPNTDTEIYCDDQFVIKCSKNNISNKIKKESGFYKNIVSMNNDNVISYFPKYFGYFVKNGKNKIILEYLTGFQNLSSFLITKKSRKISEKYLNYLSDKLIEILKTFSEIKVIEERKVDLFQKLYIKRVQTRLRELERKNHFFKRINNREYIYINGKKYSNLKKQFNEFIIRENTLSELKNNQESSFFHGDFHFENILVDTSGSIKLIDPNGDTCGLISYDIGKLLHSIVCKYSLIQENLYHIEQQNSENFNFKVKSNHSYDLFCDILLKKIKKNFDKHVLLQSYFACWCHMISLIVHHLNNNKKQPVAFYLQAVLMGDKFLLMYNNFLNKKYVKD
jgi:thiamine kinase-like enzyme